MLACPHQYEHRDTFWCGACTGASKPAANGYYEVDMSPETVHLKLTVTAAKAVTVALKVEVCTP